VHYELNAYTDQPGKMAKIYSDLHRNIQGKFNDAGVEIMSPHYSSVRDGNQVAIPADSRPKGYSAPVFRLAILQDLLNPPHASTASWGRSRALIGSAQRGVENYRA